MNARYQLYFAYGSNMQGIQFRQRCPESAILGRATLPRYRFIITTRGFAGVVPCRGSTVHGVLAALTPWDEARLDGYEGVSLGFYLRKLRWVETEMGYTVGALVYIAQRGEVGVPRPGYLERVIAGAREQGLPDDAIAAIASWGCRG